MGIIKSCSISVKQKNKRYYRGGNPETFGLLGKFFTLALRPFAKDRRADPHQRCSLFDGDFEVMAHPH